ncbi:MAG: cytochrome c family protein [Pseudomonadota bacterium]
MDQQTSEQALAETAADQGDLVNTIAGWVLFAGIVGLGLSVLSEKYFHGSSPERPEQLGYVIEGVEVEDTAAPVEMSMAEALTLVSAEDGEKVYAKCASCHTLTPGGANGVGPNLHAIIGAPVGKKPGFQYSGAMAEFGGEWGWEEMNEWLKAPKRYIDGTKMNFAGLSKVEDRAAVALFMNQAGSNLPLPEFTAEVEVVEGEEAAADADVEATAEAEQNAAESTSEETAEAQAAE